MVQVCPFCKRTINEEETVCPHCGNTLSTENDWIQNRKQYYKRQDRLYILGFTLLASAVIYWLLQWRGVFTPDWLTGGVFAVIWVTGFTVYCIYLWKGEKGIPWIH